MTQYCTYADIIASFAAFLSGVAVLLGVINMALVRRLGFKIT